MEDDFAAAFQDKAKSKKEKIIFDEKKEKNVKYDKTQKAKLKKKLKEPAHTRAARAG